MSTVHARMIDGPADIAEGLEALVRLDRRLAPVIDRAGPVPLRREPPGFEGLARIIVSQMVSKASAEALWRRLLEETGNASARRVLLLSPEQCRTIGLSRAKEETLRRTAAAVIDGAIDPRALCAMPAAEAVAVMTATKGIGLWTAEVYLLFCAGHRDIFPAGDVALRSAAGHALGYRERPDQKTVRALAEAWQPWRGVAARLLWAYYANAMRRGDAVPVR